MKLVSLDNPETVISAVPVLSVIPELNELKNYRSKMSDYTPCKNCAFHNPNVEYECEMTTEVPVICSVKMRKMKQEKMEVKKI